MPNWTTEQQAAIDERSKTLLVSAAAGSGKTATLTERIIRSLTDTENPVCIDTLLVVTFTKAAAGELRRKISKELSRAVRENPDSAHLKRQLYMLPSARICTIDAYCGEILRQNCERVGIAPGYRIAEGIECELLANSILSALIDEIYSGALPEVATADELFSLSESLTDAKNTESINDVLKSLYRSLESMTEGVGAFSEIVSLYDTSRISSPDASPHFSYVKDRLRECAQHYLAALRVYYETLSSGDDYERGVSGTCASDIAILESIVCKNSYSELRELLLNLKFSNLYSKRGAGKTPEILDYCAVRDGMKEDILDYKRFFLYAEEEILCLLDSLHEKAEILYRILKKFDDAFTAEKYRMGALSFADVERLAYECLWQNGEPTDVALSIRASLSAVYIDEYQDVNDIQNKIFEAISREDNRFMVGDVKQSIYRFRNANPDIFTSTKRSLPDLPDATVGASLFMSKNFRSDKAIIDFVNEVFDRVFGLCGESIDYREGDRLSFGKGESAPEYRAPEVCVVTKSKPDDEGYISEPRAVALKIKSLIDSGRLNSGEPIKPQDVAIILRSTKTRGALYAEELSRLGIPARLSGDGAFFFSSEVLLAMCLLNSIDNPRRDVYLAGLMTSPLYAFSQEELYRIREAFPKGSLYESLTLFAESSGDTKCTAFLEKLAHYRRISEGIPIDRLLYRLYRETGLFALAKKSGGGDNLRLLYDYARRFSEGEFKGLYSFISFINSIEDKETSFDDKRDAEDADSVEIITAHSSKGLEYPVVFFANASGKFKNHERGSRLAFSRKYGVGMKLRREGSLALVNNPIYDMICHHSEREDYEEELRILYVVLTRARERLFVTGTSPKEDRYKYEYEAQLSHEHLSGYSVRRQGSFMDIILSASGVSPTSEDEFLSGIDRAAQGEYTEPREDSAEPDAEDLALYAELSERFAFRYPYIHETTLPEKLSVSRASPTVLDGTEGDLPSLGANPEEGERREHLPAFIAGREADESAKRGIATHYFLQFCDLVRLREIGAERELSELLRLGFISKRDAERVRLAEIKKFAESRLFADMLEAKNLYRELRFNIHIPAKYFTEDELKLDGLSDETILVQGVIDCVIEYPDGSFGVFDYKTDRLTREERESRPLAEARMAKSHRRQLEYYALAVEEIFGKKPTRVEVYSLHFGDTLSVGI